ncbi:hypothetical protein [Woodsholea maritima]|uniref:hypothetical protein n=1 Tax=Woodsholea maritima TaxID=240237 RepID=UPI000365E97B|nr:hypothetical protein [Woodsholea maritima]
MLLFSLSALTLALHPVNSPANEALDPAFDITQATASTDGRLTTFAMEVAGLAGSQKPQAIGQLTGAKVTAYVWPTSLNPDLVGFEADSGILALAITAHPDFDDTPLFDENNDGDPANDGADWHSHWAVLVQDEACGAGLKVRDVSPGVDLLPATAPMLPIALDSPGMSPVLDGAVARITVPLSNSESAHFDAVTAEMQVNEAGEAPLLCVTGVHDVASGDLSLPGIIMAEH